MTIMMMTMMKEEDIKVVNSMNVAQDSGP